MEKNLDTEHMSPTVSANQEMFPEGNNAIPDESWDLSRLTEFITVALRRTAEDAWLIGKALDLAQPQHTKNRDWLQWLQEIGISKSTAYRYLDLCRSYTLEEVKSRPGDTISMLLKKLKGEDKNDADENDADGDDAAPNDNDENDAGDDANEDNEEEQPSVTDEEFAAINVFVNAVGGVTRAEYIFKQIKDITNDS